MTNYVDTITNSVVTSLDVLKSVNDMYSTEFNRLLVVMGLLVGVGGVVLPLLFQFREAKVRRSEMKEEFQQFLKETTAELDAKVKAGIEAQILASKEEIQTIKAELNEKYSMVTGDAAHTQCSIAFDNGDYWEAADSALVSIFYRCFTNEHGNLLRVLSFLIEDIYPKLNKDDLERKGLSKKFDQVEEKLRAINKSGFLNDKLHEFVEGKKLILKRPFTPPK